MTRLASHLRANLIGYLALFVALGGTAYAAAAWTGDNIVDGTLGSADIADGSVTPQDLSKVYIEGSGRVITRTVSTTHAGERPDEPATLLELPGGARLVGYCFSSQEDPQNPDDNIVPADVTGLDVINEGDHPLYMYDSASTAGTRIEPGESALMHSGTAVVGEDARGRGGAIQLDAHAGDTPAMSLYAVARPPSDGVCEYRAQALISE
jgi:hypothetical protein